ncbi:MAG: sugar-binding protein [Oscillospiraceae bacterium]|nr:sugar-binding protein [Oscillospiraceae bacterium]
MKRLLATITILALIATSLAACGGGGATSTTSAITTAATEAATEAPTEAQTVATTTTTAPPPSSTTMEIVQAPETEAPILIGVAMPTRTVERWIYEGDLMEEQLRAAGYDVILQFANDDVATQINQIENMVSNGAKFLIICPIDGSSLSVPLRTAKAQGVQILSYDRLIMDTTDVDYFVGFNSERIGNHMGNSLMAGIGAANATPENPLYIEMFAGSLDDSNTTYYFHGAVDMIQPYLDSGAVVVKSGQTTMEQCATPGWDAGLAQNRMENLLSAYYTDDLLAGALSPYDGLSLGMIAALRAVGYGTEDRPMPAITGQDCELPSLISIWNNEQYSSIFLDFDLLVSTATGVATAMLSNLPIEKTMDYNNNVIDVASYLADAFELTKANIPYYFFERGTLTEADLQLQ